MFKFCITRRNRVVKVWHLFTMLQEQEIKLLKIPSDVIKTSGKKKKNTYGHHRKHSKFFKSELKLYSILHNADLKTEKRKETSYGTF